MTKIYVSYLTLEGSEPCTSYQRGTNWPDEVCGICAYHKDDHEELAERPRKEASNVDR